VLAGQRAAVASTDAYLAAAASSAMGSPQSVIGLNADRLIGARARNGTSLEHVYARASYVGRNEGFDRGISYLRQQVTTDFQLAHRLAAHAGMSSDTSIIGYRRVTGGGKVCALCIAASTRHYSRGDLQPIHRSCGCTVQPVHGSGKSRQVDRGQLSAIYGGAGGTDARSLGRLQIDTSRLPAGVNADAITALNVRVIGDSELGPLLDADRHDLTFALGSRS
jgi:hypothetical protein